MHYVINANKQSIFKKSISNKNSAGAVCQKIQILELHNVTYTFNHKI